MFENIPKNWKKEKLENIATVNYGTRIVKDSAIGNEYYVYGGGDKTFKTDIFNRENTLIVARFGMSPKCTRFVKGKFFLNDSGLTVDTNDEHLLNQNFLNWQLFFLNDLIYSLGKGVAQKNLNVFLFKNLDIIVPKSLNEQQEIVDVLDAAYRIIRLRKECIKSAQFLIPALFQEMFGDPLSKVDKNKIGYYFDVGTGATPRRENSEYYEGNIPWVKTTEVDNCYINSTSEHISESAVKETNCSLYPPGTILMAMYGQGKTRGKVAYLNISATTNQACAALQLKKEYENDVNLIYVFYYLQIIYEFLRTLSQGGGRPNMNLSIVRNIPLYLPDIKQQELFAEKVQELESYIKSQQAELENAKTMFQSLLHHSFTGELTRRAYGE